MQLESPIRYRPNDLVELQITKVEGNTLSLEHKSLPPVGGAVVCIENNTGYVRTLVGGLDFERSHFNRAIQAMRQPGSSFKPFIYAAALEWSQYSPQTLIIDEPIAVEIDPRGPEWIPMNSDGAFVGPIPFRDALAHSRNVVAVKVTDGRGHRRGDTHGAQHGHKIVPWPKSFPGPGGLGGDPSGAYFRVHGFPKYGNAYTAGVGKEGSGPFRKRA